jgi:hypothetical protein
VPRRVQQVFKLALREADRLQSNRLVAAAEAALNQAMRGGCSTETLNFVAGRVKQGELFSLADGRRANSPMEAEVFSSLTRDGAVSKADALRCGLDTFAASWVREIRATIVADGTVSQSAAVISAVADAFDRAADKVIRNVCLNEPLARSVEPIDLGENLLPNGWGARP